MTEQLFPAPVDVDTLGDRQRAAYDYIREHGPVSNYEIGAHLAKRFNYRPGHEIQNGKGAADSLRKKDLVRFRRGLGWMAAGADDDDGPQPSNEIPF